MSWVKNFSSSSATTSGSGYFAHSPESSSSFVTKCPNTSITSMVLIDPIWVSVNYIPSYFSGSSVEACPIWLNLQHSFHFPQSAQCLNHVKGGFHYSCHYVLSYDHQIFRSDLHFCAAIQSFIVVSVIIIFMLPRYLTILGISSRYWIIIQDQTYNIFLLFKNIIHILRL